MKSYRVFNLVCATVLILGAGTSVTALAAPSFSLLSGESFPVKFESKTGEAKLETASGKAVACTSETANGQIENATSGEASDDILGCKQGPVSCRSENEKAEKDPIETILIHGKGNLVSVQNSAKELGAAVLNSLSETLTINCGGVRALLRGTDVGLVAPINKEIATSEKATLVSRQKSGKEEFGTCIEEKALCEKLVKEPLEISLGSGFERAGTELSGTISFSKMITINA